MRTLSTAEVDVRLLIDYDLRRRREVPELIAMPPTPQTNISQEAQGSS